MDTVGEQLASSGQRNCLLGGPHRNTPWEQTGGSQTNSQNGGQLENFTPRPHAPPVCNMIGWLGGWAQEAVSRWEKTMLGVGPLGSHVSPLSPGSSPTCSSTPVPIVQFSSFQKAHCLGIFQIDDITNCQGE
jgi:hypothetical protein